MTARDLRPSSFGPRLTKLLNDSREVPKAGDLVARITIRDGWEQRVTKVGVVLGPGVNLRERWDVLWSNGYRGDCELLTDFIDCWDIRLERGSEQPEWDYP